MSYRIFISHYIGELEIAQALKNLIDETFSGHVEAFISFDIDIGQNWLTEIRDALTQSSEILTIFTFRSAERPWINIETGYGIMHRKPVTPILFQGFSISDLSTIYRLQQAVDDRDDNAILRLYKGILKRVQEKTPLARPKWSSEEFLKAWRAKIGHAVRRNPSKSLRSSHKPLIWIMGSHHGLPKAAQSQALQICRAIAHLCVEQRFCVVTGTSRLLEYLVDSYEDLAEGQTTLLNSQGDEWRKAIASAHIEDRRTVPSPVVILGMLRTPDIRTLFNDTLGRIPDIAIVIGGKPKAAGGRVILEYQHAVNAGIPVLPLAFTGGAAAELEIWLKPELKNAADALNAMKDKLDLFSLSLLDLISNQLAS